ncbi:hypothetical protein TW86_03580 [Halomonas sp. S2151]|uniref:cobaltochelatase CobT-related protein n=1 Tax=Halomonas sp. S2151 TaxID=579478 RepID=UPI0005FA6290|nr:hypothetical protein [Halomonas sp. S2151]KJZ17353.1 hypothetical protein TW86_03580 [Halomonas sp. S2151]
MAITKTNIRELCDSIETVVRLLSDRGIKVTQQGMKAYVSYEEEAGAIVPKRVNIPAIGESSPPDLVVAIKGFVDHEVAHILFTDPKILARAKSEGIAGMHNIVEDCFIEAKMKKTFPGSIRNIDKTLEFACRRFFQKAYDEHVGSFEHGSGEESQAKFFLNALAVPGIRALAGHESAIDFMKDKWPLVPIVHELLEPLTEKMQRLNSSLAALNMAHTIRDLMIQAEEEEERREEEEKAPEEKAPEESPSVSDETSTGDPGKDGDSGDESDSDSSGDGKGSGEEPSDDGDSGMKGDKSTEEKSEGGDGDDSDASDGEGAEANASGSEAGSDGEKSDMSGKGSSEDPELEDREGEEHGDKIAQNVRDMDTRDSKATPDFGSHDGTVEDRSDLLEALDEVKSFEDALEECITEGSLASLNEQSYQPYSTDGDRIEKFKPNSRQQSAAKDRLKRIAENNRDSIGTMSKQLERLVAARNRSMFVPGFRSGRLHSSSLYKLKTGDTRVFRRKEEVTTKNTAVMLLVDCSGSMKSNDRIAKAAEAAFALCSSLELINVPTQVMGFTTGHNYDLMEAAQREMEELADKYPTKPICFDRIENLELPIFKTFDERMTPDVKQSLASIPFYPLRNNADGESVEAAGNILMRRQEERKILVVLSDGQPAMQSLPSRAFFDKFSYHATLERACEHLRGVVTSLENSGIETLGIGIETPEVKSFYPKNIVLDKVEELPEKVMNELSQMLLK